MQAASSLPVTVNHNLPATDLTFGHSLTQCLPMQACLYGCQLQGQARHLTLKQPASGLKATEHSLHPKCILHTL